MRVRIIPYSQFKQYLANDEVAEAEIKQDEIDGKIVPKPQARPGAADGSEREVTILSSLDCSEETARLIDAEVKKLLDDAHESARAILKEHHDQLELVANELLKRETLDATAFNALIGRPNSTGTAHPGSRSSRLRSPHVDLKSIKREKNHSPLRRIRAQNGFGTPLARHVHLRGRPTKNRI
jgi:ATP-dependent Zn protease